MRRRDPPRRYNLRRFNDAVHYASQQMLHRNRCAWRLNRKIGLSCPFIDQSPGIPSGPFTTKAAAVGKPTDHRDSKGWAAPATANASLALGRGKRQPTRVPSRSRAELIRDIQVRAAFDLLNVVSGNLSPLPAERTAF